MGRNVESSNSLENIYKARKIWYQFYFSFLPGYQETQRYVFCLKEEVFFNPTWYCHSVLGSFENLQFPLTQRYFSGDYLISLLLFNLRFPAPPITGIIMWTLKGQQIAWGNFVFIEFVKGLPSYLLLGLGDNLERKYFSSDTWHPSFPFHPRN